MDSNQPLPGLRPLHHQLCYAAIQHVVCLSTCQTHPTPGLSRTRTAFLTKPRLARRNRTFILAPTRICTLHDGTLATICKAHSLRFGSFPFSSASWSRTTVPIYRVHSVYLFAPRCLMVCSRLLLAGFIT